MGSEDVDQTIERLDDRALLAARQRDELAGLELDQAFRQARPTRGEVDEDRTSVFGIGKAAHVPGVPDCAWQESQGQCA